MLGAIERRHPALVKTAFPGEVRYQGGQERIEIVRCACRKSNPDIFVMQSAEDWAAKNTPCPLNSTR
jgi:hypothetical protein